MKKIFKKIDYLFDKYLYTFNNTKKDSFLLSFDIHYDSRGAYAILDGIKIYCKTRLGISSIFEVHKNIFCSKKNTKNILEKEFDIIKNINDIYTIPLNSISNIENEISYVYNNLFQSYNNIFTSIYKIHILYISETNELDFIFYKKDSAIPFNISYEDILCFDKYLQKIENFVADYKKNRLNISYNMSFADISFANTFKNNLFFIEKRGKNEKII